MWVDLILNYTKYGLKFCRIFLFWSHFQTFIKTTSQIIARIFRTLPSKRSSVLNGLTSNVKKCFLTAQNPCRVLGTAPIWSPVPLLLHRVYVQRPVCQRMLVRFECSVYDVAAEDPNDLVLVAGRHSIVTVPRNLLPLCCYYILRFIDGNIWMNNCAWSLKEKGKKYILLMISKPFYLVFRPTYQSKIHMKLWKCGKCQ